MWWKDYNLVRTNNNLSVDVSWIIKSTKVIISTKSEKNYDWTIDSEMIVIKNITAFKDNILLWYFDHHNNASFARQLNFYSYRRLMYVPLWQLMRNGQYFMIHVRPFHYHSYQCFFCFKFQFTLQLQKKLMQVSDPNQLYVTFYNQYFKCNMPNLLCKIVHSKKPS